MLKTHPKSLFRVRSWAQLEDDNAKYVTLQVETTPNGDFLVEQVERQNYNMNIQIEYKDGYRRLNINDKTVAEGYFDDIDIMKILAGYVPGIAVQVDAAGEDSCKLKKLKNESDGLKFKYKGYMATVEWDGIDKIFVGKVDNVPDILAFHGNNLLEIQEMFLNSIDNYIGLVKNFDK